jgi:hypothetical protein
LSFNSDFSVHHSTFGHTENSKVEEEMSFGFGVGDFINVVTLAKKIRREFVSAPSQFENILDEYVV